MALLLAGPCAGKSHQHGTTFVDVERVLSLSEHTLSGEMRDASQGGEWNLLPYFMNHVLLAAFACIRTGRVLATNLITPHSVSLLRFLVRGLAAQGVAVRVFQFADERELEIRVEKRKGGEGAAKFLFRQGNYAHVMFCHHQLLAFASLHPSIRIVNELQVPPKEAIAAQAGRQHFSWASKQSQHEVVEVAPHVFAEFVDGDLHNLWEQAGDAEYVCMQNTKVCRGGHGFECSMRLVCAEREVRILWNKQQPADIPVFQMDDGATLLGSKFLPTHKLRIHDLEDDRPICVLALYGSFAPMHRGHIEMADVAKRYIEGHLGYRVAGAYCTPMMTANGRKKGMVPMLERWRIRSLIAELAIARHEFLMLDPQCRPFSSDFSTHASLHLADRLEKHFGKRIRVFWVNGSDAGYHPGMVSEENFRKSGRDVALLVIPPRVDGEDNFARSGLQPSENIIRCDVRQELNISSTAIRVAIQDGRLTDAAALIGDDAAFAITLYCFEKAERAAAKNKLKEQAEKQAKEAKEEESRQAKLSFLGGLFGKK